MLTNETKITRTQTKTKVTRLFEVFDTEKNFVEKFEKIYDLTEFLGINKTTVYTHVNTNEPVKTNVGDVFINYKKEKTTTTIKFEVPFKLSQNRIIQIPDLPGEIWKNIPGFPECNFVSNKGRFKIVDAFGNETFGTMRNSRNKTGKIYKEISIERLDSNNLHCRLSRALVRTFIDPAFGLTFAEDKRVVDHIDNNPENNCIENLRICTSSENSRNAIYEQNVSIGKKTRKVIAVNDDGEVFKFKSLNECARFFNVKVGTVWTCINKWGKVKGKYKVSYEEK